MNKSNDFIARKLAEFEDRWTYQTPKSSGWYDIVAGEAMEWIESSLKEAMQTAREEVAREMLIDIEVITDNVDNINVQYQLDRMSDKYLKSEGISGDEGKELCGCEADEWGIEHYPEAHLPEESK